MKVNLKVEMDIELIDDDLGDPQPGDPLYERMRESVREAVDNALEHGTANGFSHDMEILTGMSVFSVGLVDEWTDVPTREGFYFVNRGGRIETKEVQMDPYGSDQLVIAHSMHSGVYFEVDTIRDARWFYIGTPPKDSQ